MKYTKKNYEELLNKVDGNNAGTRLRKNDPICFDVQFNEWVRLAEVRDEFRKRSISRLSKNKS